MSGPGLGSGLGSPVWIAGLPAATYIDIRLGSVNSLLYHPDKQHLHNIRQLSCSVKVTGLFDTSLTF